MYKIVNRKKLAVTIAVDCVGKILFLPMRLLRRARPIEAQAVRRILVIRTAYLGDVMMTVPLLKPLRERFANAKISFLTSLAAAPLLEGNPYVDEVIQYNPSWFYGKTGSVSYLQVLRDLRRRSFDLVIETRADIRELIAFVAPLKARYKVSYDVGGGGYLLSHVVPYPGLKHKVDYHLDIARYLGCSLDDELDYGIRMTEEDDLRIKSVLQSHNICGPYICVHPGGRLPLKRWGEENCVALYDRLIQETGMPLVILGSKDEQGLVSRIGESMSNSPCSLAGELSLRELAGTLAGATAFVCNDSGPMHIAAAMGTPTVAIFGPSKSFETSPYRQGHRVVEEAFECRYTCDEGRCRSRDFHACMRSVAVDKVFEAVKAVLLV